LVKISSEEDYLPNRFSKGAVLFVWWWCEALLSFVDVVRSLCGCCSFPLFVLLRFGFPYSRFVVILSSKNMFYTCLKKDKDGVWVCLVVNSWRKQKERLPHLFIYIMHIWLTLRVLWRMQRWYVTKK
jgi:hypothetical protein